MGEAFYNEIDPVAAATMREAMARGLIAPGVVDERDIRDILPNELAGFAQVHLFAGGGIWSYALRQAGWPDDAPIWTCSCPCQPFSAAGKGGGFDDERHLWPAAQWLIEQCGPECVAGEQVADKGADPWIDLVQADLEAMDYTFGCVPLASAGFGAPNPRHRTFWVAHAASSRRERLGGRREAGASEHRHADGLGDAMRHGAGSIGRDSDCAQGAAERDDRDIPGACIAVGNAGSASGVAVARRLLDERRGECGEPLREAGSFEGEAQQRQRSGINARDRLPVERLADPLRAGRPERWPLAGYGSIAGSGGPSDSNPGPVNGFWADADWLYCRDPRGARWRPVDAGTFPLAPGHPARVGGLRISGNAINAQVATAFIEAVMDTLANPLSRITHDH